MSRLAADAAHGFGGMALDRARPLRFRLDGRTITGFAGDTVSAVLAAGIDAAGRPADAAGARPGFRAAGLMRGGTPLPMARLPAADKLDLKSVGRRRFAVRHGPSLDHLIAGVADPPWLTASADETLATDLLVVGGGLAGLAAAAAAARAGHSVVLAERRPWLGGDARYYGPVGDAASPADSEAMLLEKLAARPGVTLLTHTEVFALTGGLARLHRVVDGRGRVVAVTAARVVLATGSVERLPVFAGNRLPGVVGAIAAYHLAKRYGVGRGSSAVVATGSNFGYRLALRLHDAGIAIGRIVDPRVNPQSRFVDFAKASGLTLSGGLVPARASEAGRALDLAFADARTGQVSLTLTADRLILAGALQPDLTLWMRAGGGTLWQEGELRPRRHARARRPRRRGGGLALARGLPGEWPRRRRDAVRQARRACRRQRNRRRLRDTAGRRRHRSGAHRRAGFPRCRAEPHHARPARRCGPADATGAGAGAGRRRPRSNWG